MKKQNIEDIFSSMENFSSVPPPELWANIEEKLDKPKKKKRAIIWWSAAASLLLGLLLPSVLYFTSNSGIKTINGSGIENNKVVLDENKKEQNDKTPIKSEQNNSNQQSDDTTNSIVESNSVQTDNSEGNQTEETAVASTEASSKINSSKNLNSKSNRAKNNINQALAEKNTVAEKQNQLNSFSRNQKLNSEKANANQAVAEKTFVYGKQNSFNTASKNQFSNPEKRNADKILAEKTFVTKKKNAFNSPKNQTPASIFEDKLNSNSNNVAFNASNSSLGNKQNGAVESEKNASNEIVKTDKAIAENTPKSNSKFKDVILSKQDSVQLAELQNLEKGIITPEVKKGKEKDPKALSNSDKWALEVFAGIANSENTKNEKTLGNVNDSKQSNTYGVKTKYKINKKWAVGSGFKINELGQSVANVSYISTKNNAFLGTGDYLAQNSSVPQIASNNASGVVLLSSTTKTAISSDNIQSGNLDQSLRYIEMPLEVSYSVFSKNKANITLNTGGFVGKLISNNVALDGNNIGQNVNANDFVYGSTLSSTVQYRVYKKTNVFVEPAMNYYVNPLNSQSFNQFQWGLNFGLNVSF
ncbi:hypothetical protein IR010_08985 [Flavobacterium sp. MR2016-29]|uniref:hypothetical protein n=1 Tax=Flavobacterium sp. MR2016-29 TaxID=2783795 RepID=UPI00188C8076|nr:hypothetical protein [Flavobacterium sp. MR2016-29]MBF4492673.1 hypothetical protein [Flavobacterium sp. MR2016-29]